MKEDDIPMAKNSKYRDNNRAIAKFTSNIAEAEKTISHRKLRAKALCTHTKDPMVPNLVPKDENGKVLWVCRTCGEIVDLTRITDDDLKKAIYTLSQACNMIKIMSTGSENDRRIVETVIADVQLKANAYIFNAYKSALNSSQKKNNRRNGNRRSRGVTWE